VSDEEEDRLNGALLRLQRMDSPDLGAHIGSVVSVLGRVLADGQKYRFEMAPVDEGRSPSRWPRATRRPNRKHPTPIPAGRSRKPSPGTMRSSKLG
jgi:hypothetical protein